MAPRTAPVTESSLGARPRMGVTAAQSKHNLEMFSRFSPPTGPLLRSWPVALWPRLKYSSTVWECFEFPYDIPTPNAHDGPKSIQILGASATMIVPMSIAFPPRLVILCLCPLFPQKCCYMFYVAMCVVVFLCCNIMESYSRTLGL